MAVSQGLILCTVVFISSMSLLYTHFLKMSIPIVKIKPSISELESAHQLFEHKSLTGKLLGSSSTFLSSSGVCLNNAGDLLHTLSYLSYHIGLNSACVSDLSHNVPYLFGAVSHIGNSPCSLLGDARAVFNSRNCTFDKYRSLLCSLGGLGRKVSYLVRNNRKALARISRSCCLNRSVQSKNIRLERNVFNSLDYLLLISLEASEMSCIASVSLPIHSVASLM